MMMILTMTSAQLLKKWKYGTSLRDIVIDAERLPEIKQFARLLNDIRARILDDRTDSLLERLAVLG